MDTNEVFLEKFGYFVIPPSTPTKHFASYEPFFVVMVWYNVQLISVVPRRLFVTALQ
jgi:hypothetical protein